MPRLATELSPLQVKRLSEPGLYFVGGVSGLALQVLPTGGRSWILRATVGGRRRDMGLGGYPSVQLAEARQRARA
ncbi:MAG: Arm DNA-binding domain-containing protein, partial [Burkholderiaceae bacterium]